MKTYKMFIFQIRMFELSHGLEIVGTAFRPYGVKDTFGSSTKDPGPIRSGERELLKRKHGGLVSKAFYSKVFII